MCFLSITDLQKFFKIVAENKTTDVARCWPTSVEDFASTPEFHVPTDRWN